MFRELGEHQAGARLSSQWPEAARILVPEGSLWGFCVWDTADVRKG